jgi:hypothetical protein
MHTDLLNRELTVSF